MKADVIPSGPDGRLIGNQGFFGNHIQAALMMVSRQNGQL